MLVENEILLFGDIYKEKSTEIHGCFVPELVAHDMSHIFASPAQRSKVEEDLLSIFYTPDVKSSLYPDVPAFFKLINTMPQTALSFWTQGECEWNGAPGYQPVKIYRSGIVEEIQDIWKRQKQMSAIPPIMAAINKRNFLPQAAQMLNTARCLGQSIDEIVVIDDMDYNLDAAYDQLPGHDYQLSLYQMHRRPSQKKEVLDPRFQHIQSFEEIMLDPERSRWIVCDWDYTVSDHEKIKKDFEQRLLNYFNN